MVDISIIIVNYKVKDYIMPCIESIYETVPKMLSFEIIVVDNHSQDGSVEAIQSTYPDVLLIENHFNEGFSKGINRGASKSSGQYLFILNPDTILQNNAISTLLASINQDENIGAVGPQLISVDGHRQQSYWKFPTFFNTILSLLYMDKLNYKKNYYGFPPHKIFDVDSISGGAIFIRSHIFNLCNGFDTNLFWMEDIDLCYRLNKKGFRTVYSSEATVIHFQGKSATQNYRLSIYNQLISKIKYFKKHGTRFGYWGLSACIFFIATIKMIILSGFTPFQEKYRSKFIGYFSTIKWILSGKIGQFVSTENNH